MATEDSDDESDNERANHPNKPSLQPQPSICWNSRLYIQFERASNRRQQKPQYQTVQTAVVWNNTYLVKVIPSTSNIFSICNIFFNSKIKLWQQLLNCKTLLWKNVKKPVFSVSHFTNAFSMKYITIFLQIGSPNGLARLYKSTPIKYNVGRPLNSWVSQNQRVFIQWKITNFEIINGYTNCLHVMTTALWTQGPLDPSLKAGQR